MASVRIDKWLWAVRIYKTRSQASDACRNGKIEIDGSSVKPSRTVSPDDIIIVKKPPYTYKYLVKGLIVKRVSAKIAASHVEDITPEEDILNVKTVQESAFFQREKGTGRPTKKDRRLIDRLKPEA